MRVHLLVKGDEQTARDAVESWGFYVDDAYLANVTFRTCVIEVDLEDSKQFGSERDAISEIARWFGVPGQAEFPDGTLLHYSFIPETE